MSAETQKNSNGMKYKSFNFEVKALQEDDKYRYFEGYLSTYGNVDRVGEVMDRGCFDDSLRKMKPTLLWQHKRTEVIGVFSEIRSDEIGLWVKGKMPKDDELVSGRVWPQMEVGSVRSMSVGFWPIEYEMDNDGVIHHTKSDLVEGSLVAFPANPNAIIHNIKSFTIEDVEEIKTKRDFEQLLRDSGAFSNKAVVFLASRFKEDEAQGEPDSMKSFVSELKDLTKQIKGR